MIRQLIIPGIITAGAHAALFFSPNRPPPPPPPSDEVVREVIFFKAPDDPPVMRDDETTKVDTADLKPVPLVFETVSVGVDSLFTQAYVPTIPTPTIGGDTTMTIPVGDIANAGPRNARGGTRLLSLIDLDNKPRTMYQGAPDYPYTQKSLGNNGEVLVNFTVDENGFVRDVEVVKSTHPDFESPTIKAVGKWRFEPGKKDGKRVRFRMSVPVSFNINDAE